MLRLLAVVLASLGLAAPAAAAPPTATTAPTRVVEAGGIELGYRIVGRGRPIVLIQGLSGTMDGWDPALVDALARGGRRVVLFDNEGMGRSEIRPETLTIRRMADDAAALIRRLRLRRPDVLGYSMGGMIAQSLAVRRPALVRRLVLCATAPGDGEATLPAPESLQALTGAGGPFAALDFLFPAGEEAARAGFAGRLLGRRDARPSGPDAVSSRQLAATVTWLTGDDPAGHRVTRLRKRVLVAGGTLDRLLPVSNQRHLASVIPGARLVSYPDAAHGFLFQHARAFAARVGRFLR